MSRKHFESDKYCYAFNDRLDNYWWPVRCIPPYLYLPCGNLSHVCYVHSTLVCNKQATQHHRCYATKQRKHYDFDIQLLPDSYLVDHTLICSIEGLAFVRAGLRCFQLA